MVEERDFHGEKHAPCVSRGKVLPSEEGQDRCMLKINAQGELSISARARA